MNRPSAAHMPISPLHLQQGLFALLVVLLTLVAVQLVQRVSPAAEPAPQQVVRHVASQTHFSAIGAQAAERNTYHLTPVDQAQSADDLPRQQRWVF